MTLRRLLLALLVMASSVSWVIAQEQVVPGPKFVPLVETVAAKKRQKALLSLITRSVEQWQNLVYTNSIENRSPLQN
ncbi:MAG: hypothetical protein R3C11_09830 [Planctomycetaceae bacterium]